MLSQIQKELKKIASPQKAKILARFFKTGPDEYGEGDVFLGVVVPEQRKIAKKYADTSLTDLQKLLNGKIHEYRLTALLILIEQYKSPPARGGVARSAGVVGERTWNKKQLVNFYLRNTSHINNWDLVDLSAPNILGDYLLTNDRKVLYRLAGSKNLWERRLAIIATFSFIRHSQFKDTFKIAKILLGDKHDLIHKAVGWMLREVGKRDQKTLENFLEKYHQQMPRTMLRYAIERLPENKRKEYLSSTFSKYSAT